MYSLGSKSQDVETELIGKVSTMLTKLEIKNELPELKISGYKLDNTFINSAPFMVGDLIEVKGKNDSIEFFTDNFLKSEDLISNAVLFEQPLLSQYINSSVKSDFKLFTWLKGKLDEFESMRVVYETVYSSTGKRGFIDQVTLSKKLGIVDYIEKHNGETFPKPNLQIIRSVLINKLTYTKYKKFTGSIGAHLSLVNLNGELYSQEGEELVIYEFYIQTSSIRLDWARVKAGGTLNLGPMELKYTGVDEDKQVEGLTEVKSIIVRGSIK